MEAEAWRALAILLLVLCILLLPLLSPAESVTLVRPRAEQRRSSQRTVSFNSEELEVEPPPPPPSPPPVQLSQPPLPQSQPPASSPWRPDARCLKRGVFSPTELECRCTAGWAGPRCERHEPRACNVALDDSVVHFDSLCAGNCDEDRGTCYCAGLASPYQRPLPHVCAPSAHRKTRLPDGRPAYPVRTADGRWRMANMYFEQLQNHQFYNYTRGWQTPFEAIYGEVKGNPASPGPRTAAAVARRRSKLPFCVAPPSAPREQTGCARATCPEGRMGPYCELPKRAFCLRDCSGHGRCDGGFCWCAIWQCAEATGPSVVHRACGCRRVGAPDRARRRCDEGWHGIDCGLHHSEPRELLQTAQNVRSPTSSSPLRVYVYDMPSEFTTRLLQWRSSAAQGAPDRPPRCSPKMQSETARRATWHRRPSLIRRA